jgi:hypothetical protein
VKLAGAGPCVEARQPHVAVMNRRILATEAEASTCVRARGATLLHAPRLDSPGSVSPAGLDPLGRIAPNRADWSNRAESRRFTIRLK